MTPRALAPCLLVAGLLLVAPPARGQEPPPEGPPSRAYRTSAEIEAGLRALARRFVAAGTAAEVLHYGQSAGGRPLLALRVRGATPTVLVHGGLGARDAAGAVSCLEVGVRLLADDAARRRVGWLLVPAPNPDALDAFLAGRRPGGDGVVDRDRDGRRGEDGPQDVDGDGEVLRMRRAAVAGAWAAGPDGRLLEEVGVDTRRAASFDVFDEGLDDDGDGRLNEDPPVLDLTRQFAGWWDEKAAPWRGDGPFPGRAPEVQALMELSWNEAGLVAWYGFTGTGTSVLRASENGKEADHDDALYRRILPALKDVVLLDARKASEVRQGPPNPGSDLDWAAVHLGVVAFRIPVWWIPKRGGEAEPKEGPGTEADWLAWNDRVLGGRGFQPWRAFEHPTLGAVEIGGWRRFTRYEPPAERLGEVVHRAAGAPLVHLPFVPVLDALVDVEARGLGVFVVHVRAANRGDAPTDTHVAVVHRQDAPVLASIEPGPGVERLAGRPVERLGRLEAGATSADEATWVLRIQGDAVRLGEVVLRHPRADTVRAKVRVP